MSVALDETLSTRLRACYLKACEMELRALKPGNVGVHAAGHGMTVEGFRASARASAAPLSEPGRGLGERVYRAVVASRAVSGTNTNLGIILLVAPLLEAAAGRGALRPRVRAALGATGVEDARWVYRAIRVAAPGGLGKSDRYDVAEEPEWTLLEAMRYARARDRIAGEYASGYAEVFEYAVPRWRRFHAQWGDEAWATTAVYLGLLARDSDSHVARKWGQAVAREVSAVAARLEQELSRLSHPERMAAELRDQDAAFKRAGINPGTTADLVVAALLAVGLEDLLDPVPRRVLCSES